MRPPGKYSGQTEWEERNVGEKKKKENTVIPVIDISNTQMGTNGGRCPTASIVYKVPVLLRWGLFSTTSPRYAIKPNHVLLQTELFRSINRAGKTFGSLSPETKVGGFLHYRLFQTHYLDLQRSLIHESLHTRTLNLLFRQSKLYRSQLGPATIYNSVAVHHFQGADSNPQYQIHRPLERDIGYFKAIDRILHMKHPVISQEANPRMIRQLETSPIAGGHLHQSARETYGRLVTVEKQCIEVISSLSKIDPETEVSKDQWKTVISLHQLLLHEHHDFLLTSQHPAASPVLKNFSGKYAIPARMWCYGIHSCLELLRKRLPTSLDHMLAFIYHSYSIMTLLFESVPYFRGTWIECLGDLARYRMAVEHTDVADRNTWAGVSRYWYNQETADQYLEVGRIQHHLAVLSRPDTLLQFFYYMKALTSVRPFANARESMAQLFNPIMNAPVNRYVVIISFVAAHGALFMHMSVEQFVARSRLFLSNLRQKINRLNSERQQGVFITCCNIGAIFQYGDKYGAFAPSFIPGEKTTAGAYAIAMQWASTTKPIDPNTHPYTDLSSQFAFRASSLTFHTLIIILGQADNPNIHPTVHASMAFVWCLVLHPAAIQRLEPLVSWMIIAGYLNTLLQVDTDIAKIEDESFPRIDDTIPQQLPEDFLIRGWLWSQLYYPTDFFDETAIGDDGALFEKSSTILSRTLRCLWLGVRIATVGSN